MPDVSCKHRGMRLLQLLPPIAWTVLIAWLSTDTWSAAETAPRLFLVLRWLLPGAAPDQVEALHWLARKAAHAIEYGVLAALWSRALGSRDRRRGWIAPLGLSVLTATIDELHQSMTNARMGSVADVVLDGAAASAALIGGPAARWLTSALLWIAAVGGTAAIAFDWNAGVPAGWLWASVPLAWMALVFWRRSRS
jgi:VanZ family protein